MSVLLRTQSDERLVALARAGHERAFEAIVQRYRPLLVRSARRYLSDARAEDAVQQAFLAAWSALQRGDDVRELRPWLYRIVHNTALNALRAVGYDHAELPDSVPGHGSELERRMDVHEALSGLAALPERQREALLRIAVEGRPQTEVAAELGVSEGAVRQLVHRARMTLRAAATAITPLPFVTWAVAGGGVAVKVGTVAVVATTAVAVPVAVRDEPRAPVAARAAPPSPTPTAVTRIVPPAATRTPTATPRSTPAPRRAAPTPTATARPRPSATAWPRPAPVRTATATATATPAPRREPTATPTATPRREPTATATPRSEPAATATPPATATPAATPPPYEEPRTDNSGPGSGSSGSGSSGSGSGNSGPGSNSSGPGSGGDGEDSGDD